MKHKLALVAVIGSVLFVLPSSAHAETLTSAPVVLPISQSLSISGAAGVGA